MMEKLASFFRRPERIFLAVAITFGLISVFAMPILGVPDENQHFQVEYAIFSSHKLPPKDIILNENIILNSVRNHSYKHYYSHITQADKDGVAVNTNATVFGGVKASIFNVIRLPQALGVLVGRLFWPTLAGMVLAGRLINLALYVVALYFIIKYVRYGKWTFVFIACLPIMIQQAASLSYDSNNLLVVFAWVALIINIFTQKELISLKQMALGAVLALSILLSKQNNILLFALLLAVPWQNLLRYKLVNRLVENRRWPQIRVALLAGLSLFIVATSLVILKILTNHQPFHPVRLAEVLANTFVTGDLGLIDVCVKGLVGVFSNFYYGLPMWAVVAALVVLCLTMLEEKGPRISKRLAVLSGVLFFASILLITIGMYYNWAMRPDRLGPNAAIADGIQGRYFTPMLVLLYPAFAYCQRFFKIVTSKKHTIPLLVTSTSVLLLVIYVLQTWDFFWR